MSRRSLGIALAAIALGAMTTVPAQAAPAGNAIIEIKSVVHGTCLQATETTSPDTTGDVRLAPCDGSPAQQWEQAAAGNNTIVLRNVREGHCLTAWSYPTQWYCDVQDGEQTFDLLFSTSGEMKLKAAHNAQNAPYLTAGFFPDGSPYMTSDGSGPHARWLTRQVGRTTPPTDTAGQTVRLKSHYRGLCTQPGNLNWLDLAVCDGSAGQRYQRVELADGWFQLTQNGKCLSATDFWAELSNACAAADVTQRWRFDADSLGLMTIRNANGRLLGAEPPDRNRTYMSPPASDYRYSQNWEVSVA